MEPDFVPLIAALGGASFVVGMGVKAAIDAALFRASPSGDVLDLRVNGKDFTVDLKTIANSGSEKIDAALREFERWGTSALRREPTTKRQR